MKKILLALAACAVLAGCNTVKGMGEDIKAAGRGIENAASKKGGNATGKPSPNNNP